MTHLSCYSFTIEGEVLFMFGKLKKLVASICLCIQIAVVIIYGFTGVHISQYVCLGIWLVCGMLGVLLLKERQAI